MMHVLNHFDGLEGVYEQLNNVSNKQSEVSNFRLQLNKILETQSNIGDSNFPFGEMTCCQLTARLCDA